MLKHADVWQAIDRLAERHGLSPSGLARKAGLSPTVFNPSKRMTGKRKRWPSTESVSRILQAVGADFEEFVALATTTGEPARTRIPLMGYAEVGQKNLFDDEGHPAGKNWDEATLPGSKDPHAFMMEISGKSLEPVYKEGDRIIVSPAEKPRRGDKVALRMQNGDVTVKILGREGAQKVEVLSLKSDHQPATLARKDITWIYRVIWASQ